MSMTDRSRQRVAGRLVVVVAFLLIVIPPAVAYAGTQITYATGTAGVGGTFKVGNFTGRDYNQVWHQAGKTWTVL